MASRDQPPGKVEMARARSLPGGSGGGVDDPDFPALLPNGCIDWSTSFGSRILYAFIALTRDPAISSNPAAHAARRPLPFLSWPHGDRTSLDENCQYQDYPDLLTGPYRPRRSRIRPWRTGYRGPRGAAGSKSIGRAVRGPWGMKICDGYPVAVNARPNIQLRIAARLSFPAHPQTPRCRTARRAPAAVAADFRPARLLVKQMATQNFSPRRAYPSPAKSSRWRGGKGDEDRSGLSPGFIFKSCDAVMVERSGKASAWRLSGVAAGGAILRASWRASAPLR